jgi:hypothetical protein
MAEIRPLAGQVEAEAAAGDLVDRGDAGHLGFRPRSTRRTLF